MRTRYIDIYKCIPFLKISFEPSVGFYELIFTTGTEVSEILIQGVRFVRNPLFEADSTYMIKVFSTINESEGFDYYGFWFKVN